MVLAISNIWTINNNLDYRHVQNALQIMFGILAGLLYISTGIFAFNQDQFDNLVKAFGITLLFPPSILLLAIELDFLSNLAKLIRKSHEEESSTINFDPFHEKKYIWFFSFWLIINVLLWGFILFLSMATCTLCASKKLNKVILLSDKEIKSPAVDVAIEAK